MSGVWERLFWWSTRQQCTSRSTPLPPWIHDLRQKLERLVGARAEGWRDAEASGLLGFWMSLQLPKSCEGSEKLDQKISSFVVNRATWRTRACERICKPFATTTVAVLLFGHQETIQASNILHTVRTFLHTSQQSFQLEPPSSQRNRAWTC